MPSVADLFVTIKLKTGKISSTLTNMAKGVSKLAQAFNAVDANFRTFDNNITNVRLNVVGLDGAIKSFQGRLVNITISTNIQAVMLEFSTFDQRINKIWLDLVSIDHQVQRMNNRKLTIQPVFDINAFFFELGKLAFMMAGFQAFNPFQNMTMRISSISIANVGARQHVNDYLGRQSHVLRISQIVVSNEARGNVNYYLQSQGHVLHVSNIDLSSLVIPPIPIDIDLTDAKRRIFDEYIPLISKAFQNIPFTLAPFPSKFVTGLVSVIPNAMGLPTQQGGEQTKEGNVTTVTPIMPGGAPARPGLFNIVNNFDFRDATITDDGIIERIREAITQQMDSIVESMRNRLSSLGGT